MVDNPQNNPFPGRMTSHPAGPASPTPPKSVSPIGGPIVKIQPQPIAQPKSTPAPAKAPAPATSKGAGGTTGDGGGIFGGVQNWFRNLQNLLTQKPSWWHGMWPISTAANTIRDAEFAMLGDLSQWNYNSQTFQGFQLTVAFTSINPNWSAPPNLEFVVIVQDLSGNGVGNNGPKGSPFDSTVVTQVTGTYVLSYQYILYPMLMSATTGNVVFNWPAITVDAASVKNGFSMALPLNGAPGNPTLTVHVTNAGAPVSGAYVFDVSVYDDTTSGHPVIMGVTGNTDANGDIMFQPSGVIVVTTDQYHVQASATNTSLTNWNQTDIPGQTLLNGYTLSIDLSGPAPVTSP